MMLLSPKSDRNAHLRAVFAETWGYFRHELLFVLWALMEVSLITPLFLGFMPWAITWPPMQVTLWLLLLMLVPLNVARVMAYLQVPLARQRRWMLVLALSLSLWAVRTLLYDLESLFDLSWIGSFYTSLITADSSLWQRDMTILLLVGYTWWRGMLLVVREPDVNLLGKRLRVGGLLVAPLAVGVAWLSLSWSIAPFLLLYFAAGLTAVSLTRAEQIEREQKARVTSMTPRWLTVILAASIGTVFLAGLVTFTATQTQTAQMGWLVILWRPLLFGLSAVFYTAFYLLTPLFTLLETGLGWLIAFWRQAYLWLFDPAQAPEVSDFRPAQDLERIRELLGNPETAVVNWRLLISLFLLLLFILSMYSLGQLYRRNRLALGENGRFQRSLGGTPEKLDDKPGLGQRLLERLGLRQRWQVALSIRRIYYQMEQAATARGYPRAESETPYEFLDTLLHVWPAHQPDTQLITEAFVRIRYGELPETAAELNQIQAAWNRLQQTPPV